MIGSSGYFAAVGGTGAAYLSLQTFGNEDGDGGTVLATALTSPGGGVNSLIFLPIVFGQPWLETASAVLGASGACSSNTCMDYFHEGISGFSFEGIVDANHQEIAGASIIEVPEPQLSIIMTTGLAILAWHQRRKS
jgi:hypothetical protein